MSLTCTEAKLKLDIIKQEAESFKILLEDYARHGTNEILDDLTERKRRLELLSQELRKDLKEKFGYYRIHVSYAKLPGIDELGKKFSGKNSVSSLFDGRTWERHSSCADIDERPGERVFRIVEIPVEFLGKRIENVRDELAIHFDREGYRFAIETEAVEFADARPELQRKNWIYALGSSALRGDGLDYVALLNARDRDRVLNDCWVDVDLDLDDRLLLVRK